jgi:predicted RNA-binding Zn-ribbon protein involved in translation (DUF1610 family)
LSTDEPKNIGHMRGLKCPGCGNNDELRVYCEVVVKFTDVRLEIMSSEFDYTDNSYTLCPVCEFEGPLERFNNGADYR